MNVFSVHFCLISYIKFDLYACQTKVNACHQSTSTAKQKQKTKKTEKISLAIN